MVKLDKIYTRGGDAGYTSIVGGKRIRKSSTIIEAIGNVDELNAFLGLVLKDQYICRFFQCPNKINYNV